MFKSMIVTATAAVILATSIAAPAHAALTANGTSMQGISANGMRLNGVGENGVRVNGVGGDTAGFAIDGIELPQAMR